MLGNEMLLLRKDIRPKQTKLSTIAMALPPLVSMLGCTPAAAGPQTMPALIRVAGQQEQRTMPQEQQTETCRVEGRDLVYSENGEQTRRRNFLDADENEIGSICEWNRVFVLTDKNLHVMFLDAEGSSERGITIGLDSTETDMTELLAPGLADWTAAGNTAYFLTLDNYLTLIPVIDMGDSIPAFRMNFDVRNAKMKVFDGLLFMATSSGELQARSFDSEGALRRSMPLGIQVEEGADFYVDDGVLHFGRQDGRNVKITTGLTVDDVRVGP